MNSLDELVKKCISIDTSVHIDKEALNKHFWLGDLNHKGLFIATGKLLWDGLEIAKMNDNVPDDIQVSFMELIGDNTSLFGWTKQKEIKG